MHILYEYYSTICLLKQNNKNKYPMYYNLVLVHQTLLYVLLQINLYLWINLGEIQ